MPRPRLYDETWVRKHKRYPPAILEALDAIAKDLKMPRDVLEAMIIAQFLDSAQQVKPLDTGEEMR